MPVILITGGAGFLGSHLTHRALQEGYDVVSIDVKNSETCPLICKNNNIKRCVAHAKQLSRSLIYYETDITEAEKVNSIIQNEQPNIIIHAAALVMDRRSMDTPREFIMTNVFGTQVMLDAAAKLETLQQFIFISTRSAVGVASNPTEAITESHQLRPINPYGASKAAAEAFIHSWNNDTNVPVKICRMQPIYGPGCRRDMLAYRTINSILSGAIIKKYGTGEAVRDWLYIDDAVDAIFEVLCLDHVFEIFNIGTGVATTTNEFISICEDIAQAKANILHVEEKRGDAFYAGIADMKKLKTATGWQSKTDLRDGIQKTLEFMQNDISN